MEPRMTLKAARELAGSHLIASCAALAALFLFIPTGQRIIASALDGSLKSGIDRTSAVAFLLNIAVILFAWRRSKDLQKALADNEVAQQSAHESAFSDHVTGLANRRELMRLLGEAGVTRRKQPSPPRPRLLQEGQRPSRSRGWRPGSQARFRHPIETCPQWNLLRAARRRRIRAPDSQPGRRPYRPCHHQDRRNDRGTDGSRHCDRARVRIRRNFTGRSRHDRRGMPSQVGHRDVRRQARRT